MTNLFQEHWKMQMHGIEPFEKARLTKSEIMNVQDTIAALQKRNLPSSQIITALQKQQPKLAMRWKAERAYWTEVKRNDTEKVGEAGEELDFERYRVILSPNACHICREKTRNGAKLFKSADLHKSGYGHVPPFHSNCYCILIPEV
jgi:hypothetical protein